MATLEEARRLRQEREQQFEHKKPIRIAFLGDGLGNAASNVVVPGAPTQNYVRDQLNSSEYYRVKNTAVTPEINKPVIISYLPWEPETEQVIGFFNAPYTFFPTSSALAGNQTAHREQHEFGGGDEVFIDSRLFLPGLMYPTNPATMRVQIKPFSYYYKRWSRYPGGSSKDLSIYKPLSGSRFVTIALNQETGEIVYRPGRTYGTEGETGLDVLDEIAGGFGNVPAPAGNEYPIGAVNLGDATTIVEWTDTANDVFDARLHISPALRDIITRVESLERGVPNDPTITTTGATASRVSSNRSNAGQIQGIEVSKTRPTNGQILKYQQASHSYVPSADTGGGGGGDVGEGLNLGTGIEVFRERSGASLTFRTLVGGTNVTISSATSTITISATDTDTLASAHSLGSGTHLFRERSASNLLFKSLSPGTNLNISSDASVITFNAIDNGALASAFSLGSANHIFRELSASNLLFKSLSAGNNINITADASKLTIDSLAGAGSGNVSLLYSQTLNKTASNTSAETSLFNAGRGSKVVSANSLVEGDEIRLTLGGLISSDGGGTRDLNIVSKLGSTSICSTGASVVNSSMANTDWHMDLIMTFRSTGAAGNVVANGLFEHDNGTEFGISKLSGTTVDTTGDLTIDVTATWGSAAELNSITCQQLSVEKLTADGLAPVAPTDLTAVETV